MCIHATSSLDMCEREIILYIYTYIRHEREIIIYKCAYLLLGHVQHVFHHLDLAAAIKKNKKS